MELTVELRSERIPTGRYPTTIIATFNQNPVCKVCIQNIKATEWAYYCDNEEFYHERHFTENHFKQIINNINDSNNRLKIHNDRLILVEVNEN